MVQPIFPLDPWGSAEEARGLLRPSGDLTITDRTPWPRFGVKGGGAASWLAGQGIVLPAVNQIVRYGDARVLRLGTDDLTLLASDAQCDTVARVQESWTGAQAPRGYSGWREEGWAWLHIAGPGLGRVLARLCAVDLRPYACPTGSLAQTRFAGVDAVVVPAALSAEILFDIAATADVVGQIAYAAKGVEP